MSRRCSSLAVGAVFVCLAVLPGCKKSKPANAKLEGNTGPAPAVAVPPGPANAGVHSDYLLFAHLDARSIREGALYTEVKQAVEKSLGGPQAWDAGEGKISRDLGIKPTAIDSVTAIVTEFSFPQPKFIVMISSSQPFDKAKAFDIRPNSQPDARGFYSLGDELLHYPDDKTAVILHPDLAQRYLDGYAKNRSGWPLTDDLSKAAAGHTVYVVLDARKAPADVVQEMKREFGALTSVQTVALSLDLKGKALSLQGRAAFPDAASAAQARGEIQQFVGMAARGVEQVSKQGPGASGDLAGLSSLKPILVETQRAINEAKVETAGSDVTLSARIAFDFDIAKTVAAVVPEIRDAAKRTELQNNLKQLGLALLNYATTYGDVMPIHGIGSGGALLKTATEKPLLSWRVAMLPYIEQAPLYSQFKLNEPWDSENNKKLIDKMPKLFAPVMGSGKPGYTRLQMVIGPNAMQPPFARMPQTFLDGTANTIAIVEAAEPVIWTKPDDVMLTGKELPKDIRKKFGGEFPNGFYVTLWDGSVRLIPTTMSDATLAAALGPADGKPPGPDWYSLPGQSGRSNPRGELTPFPTPPPGKVQPPRKP